MRTIWILVLVTLSVVVNAQDGVPELITDRPDQTESSSVVPLNSLQIETGFVRENNKTDDVRLISFAYNTTLLRFGLFNNFELRLGIDYLGEDVLANDTGVSDIYSGFGPLYTGFKVKIAEEDGWRPEVAFLGGLALPFTANKDFKTDYSALSSRFSFGHSFSERISLGYNVGVEWDGETPVPGYIYSAALGVGLTEKLGVFLEGFGLIPEEGGVEHLCDAGFTFLVLPNFQLDVSGGLGINENAIDNFFSFGFSYRFFK